MLRHDPRECPGDARQAPVRLGCERAAPGPGCRQDSRVLRARLLLLLPPLRLDHLRGRNRPVMTVSRYREYVADRGAVLLTGAPEQLMSALQRLAEVLPLIPKEDLRRVAAANPLFILPAQGKPGGFDFDPQLLFPSHPSLERRLVRHSPRSLTKWATWSSRASRRRRGGRPWRPPGIRVRSWPSSAP